MKCILCEGTGELESPKRDRMLDKAIRDSAIRSLHEAGYGIRQLQRMFKFKSPRSIQDILEKSLPKHQTFMVST